MRNNIINSVFNSAAKVAGSVDYSLFSGSQYLYAEHDGDLNPRSRPGNYWMMTSKFKVLEAVDGMTIYMVSGIPVSGGNFEGGCYVNPDPAFSYATAINILNNNHLLSGNQLSIGVDCTYSVLVDDLSGEMYGYFNTVPMFPFSSSPIEAQDEDESNGNYFIGGSPLITGYEYFKGIIKDIRIFHTNEVSNLSNIIAGEELGTEVAWWNLEEGLTDKSGNGYDLTPVGF
jgi:hypothetical protein